MKRTLAVIAVLALAAFVVWIVVTQDVTPTTAPTSNPGAGTTDGPDDSGIPVPTNALEMEVLSITDGDTLRLREPGGAPENVRLVGIDTPEVYPVYECYGDEAEAELLRLAPLGSTLWVAPDIDPYDNYDRALLYLWNADGVFLNLALVEGGFAEAIRVAPNDAYYEELLAAERAATRAGLGMWSC